MEPILSGIRANTGVDRIYLLHSSTTLSTAKKIKNILIKMRFREIFLKCIDAFSLESVVEMIFRISKQEYGNTMFINITGGTNLMAGAACASSFFIGAQAYYMLDPSKTSKATEDELLVKLPIPHMERKELTKLQITILKLLNRRSKPSSAKLLLQEGLNVSNVSRQRLSYNIRELINQNLIEVSDSSDDSRVKLLTLSHVGRLCLSWLAN